METSEQVPPKPNIDATQVSESSNTPNLVQKPTTPLSAKILIIGLCVSDFALALYIGMLYFIH